MKLVFCWIPEYLNIKKQGLNFGSAYIYKADFEEEENRLIITRTNNEKYQPGFFKIESVGFENVTAIVGENGAGKTNLLEYIGKLLTSPIEESDDMYMNKGILIFEDGNGDIYIRSNYPDMVNTSGFKFNNWESINTYNYEAIYYSPIYDFRYNTTNDTSNNRWKNVSSNFLLNNDTSTAVEASRENIEPVFQHKTQEILRLLLFIESISSNPEVRKLIEKTIFIPDYIEISLNEIREFTDNERQAFHPTFRSFLEEDFLSKHFHEENSVLNAYSSQNNNDNLKIKSWEFFHKFLLNFSTNFFHSLLRVAETSLLGAEAIWEESFRKATKQFTEHNFQQLDYVTCTESNFEQKIKFFFHNNFIFLQFIEVFKKIIFNSNNEILADHKLKIQRKSIEELIISMRQTVGTTQYNFDFINFDWEGMSSGEKSFMTLFSRLYQAHLSPHIVYNDSDDDDLDNDSYPSQIYLLIDEGEAGFHFQWQKEYIKNLITIIPHIFEQNIPIHLIFATHSPITLSDIPNHHIAFLKKKNQGETEILDSGKGVRHTFGANIHDILYDSFFMQEGFMGSFAVHKINEVFNSLERLQEGQKKLRDPKNEAPQIVPSDLKVIVSNIDEDLIRRKLEEKIAQIEYGDTKAAQVASLEAQKKHIEEQINKLKNDTDN